MKTTLCAVLVLLGLTACAGAPAAPPTVTQTVTVPGPTVTATVPGPTVTTTPVPAPVVATSSPKAMTAQIPTAVVGMNAEALNDDLRALGFSKIVYNSDTGKTVILLSNWTVTGIDNPGAVQSTDKAVVVHVTK